VTAVTVEVHQLLEWVFADLANWIDEGMAKLREIGKGAGAVNDVQAVVQVGGAAEVLYTMRDTLKSDEDERQGAEF